MSQPNILLIMVDQFRFDWMSCSGTWFVETPHIDRIAARGIRFQQAACNSPVCGPSRCSLAAGVYPHRVGNLENFINYPLEQPTYYQALRQAGYRVAVVGKTDFHKGDHFYGMNGDLPLMYHLGFTDPHQTEGKMNAAFRRSQLTNFDMDPDNDNHIAGPYQFYLREHGLLTAFVEDYRLRLAKSKVWKAWPSPLPAEHFHDSYIGRKSCEFLEQVTSEVPWHLFVSFVGPHDPWDAPAQYVDAFLDKTFPDSIKDTLDNKPEWIKKKVKKQTEGMSEQDVNQVKRHYGAAIKLIDDWVGNMLNSLEQRGLSDNTVVIFCADHGEMMGDHGLFQKSTMDEGALRIPLIIADPRETKTGTSGALAELMDLHPTILDLAGVEYMQSRLDGKSLVPQIKFETEHHKEYQFSELNNVRMIFDGRYKFIENHNDLNELYDLQNDPHELVNIIQDCPELAKRLVISMMLLRK
ncbi:sulfatase [Paenibacillus radicis (ex Xue et al. 2023)]|uniref:Sulfatase-like hydrolase/transferase n=1 Tax=Paenibacillus radicis (ex Xue et al. 2023) TaxID=2972489 RepID=A0ABT1YJK9_9BACL|nr:sulfatase-like hydrolase/transferase [Paenibacillus radicis (ex Xue et al. 2023)]MCR8632160.1 sulfatase-like hydrolase/transferase [Paenibacillus radicis (ex Xue et al. 2023)]